jgi:hypothetical protein
MSTNHPQTNENQPQTGLSAFGVSTPRPEVDANDTDDDEEYKPWLQPELLDYLYNGPPDHSTRQIANDVFGGEVTGEHIRQLLNKHDLMPETPHNRTARMAAEVKQQVNTEAESDEPVDYKKYTLRGRDDLPDGPQPVATDGGRR